MESFERFYDIIRAKSREDKRNTIIMILAVIGFIDAVAGIAYAVYRFMTPDYLDDFDDDFDDDFEEDFEDLKEETAKAAEAAEERAEAIEDDNAADLAVAAEEAAEAAEA